MNVAQQSEDPLAQESQSEELVLSVKNLSKSYPGAPDVLREVSCSIAKGERIAILGHNGSGKSTFLRCCARLIPCTADELHVLGVDALAGSAGTLRKLRKEIGFVFQQHNLVRRLSVLTNVIHGALGRSHSPLCWYQGTAPTRLREDALECLAAVGLEEFASRRADQLSGGQSQRVAIARALMQRPQMIFADEPVASLDPKAGEEVMELLYSLVQEKQITLLFTTHHLEHAFKYSQRIVALKAGRVVRDGPVDSMSESSLKEIYE